MFYKGTSFPVGKVDFMDLYAFKIYMLDVGLLLAMTDLDASVIIDGNRIFTEFKGAVDGAVCAAADDSGTGCGTILLHNGKFYRRN